MNQTRVFLIFAWLMVATLLWLEWNKDKAAPAAPAVAARANSSEWIKSDSSSITP